jgi:hypothetical protein
MPLRSSGLRTGRFEFESSRKPFSPQASTMESRAARVASRSLRTSPEMIASKALWSGIRKGSEKRFISRICGAMLMVEETSMSMTPWRIATSSRVWSPPTSCEPG